MVSNCCFYAIGQYLRHGGFIVIQKSEHGWWPHFLWSPDLISFVQFRPVEHKKWHGAKVRAKKPPVLFDGHVKPWKLRRTHGQENETAASTGPQSDQATQGKTKDPVSQAQAQDQ